MKYIMLIPLALYVIAAGLFVLSWYYDRKAKKLMKK